MNGQLKIPPKGHNHRMKVKYPDSLANKFRKLGIGDSMVVPRSKESQIRVVANFIGIAVTQRRMGSKDTTTVWRIADEKG